MSTDIATVQTEVTPMTLLDKAMAKGLDTDQLQKLMDLQERWEANEAKKAYTTAMAKFKKEAIEISKNKTVTYTNQDNTTTSYAHATLDHIVEQVVPKLSKHGLSHKWTTEQGEKGIVTVSCVITHALGYSESVSLSAYPDDSGKKNNIQRIASTVTYLERYTFLSITGLAAKGLDDDGLGSGEPMMGKKEQLEYEIRGINYMKVCYEHKDVIEQAKDFLAIDDYMAAAEALYSLPNKTLQKIGRAPTKGGIFTLEEKAKMDTEKNPAWREAVDNAMQIHKDVDRSL